MAAQNEESDMMTSNRGGYTKIIVAVIVVVVAAGAIWYFTSDVGRTKINQMADQYAHWTPENIAKDPEGYLTFCEQEANKTLQNLKASEISVAQNRASLESMQKEAEGKIGVGEKSLADLKTLYTDAEAKNTWPVTWMGTSRDKDFVKRQIVSIHRQVEGQKGLKMKVESGVKKLDAQVLRIQDARSQTQQQVAEIKTSRDLLKVQKITDDLTQKLASIKSVLQATVSTASESSGPISLEQLAAETVTAVDDTEFKSIMGM
jgi:hypothetical protein